MMNIEEINELTAEQARRAKQMRDYYDIHKDEIHARRKKNRVDCPCTGSYLAHNRSNHITTKKHIAYLLKQREEADKLGKTV